MVLYGSCGTRRLVGVARDLKWTKGPESLRPGALRTYRLLLTSLSTRRGDYLTGLSRMSDLFRLVLGVAGLAAPWTPSMSPPLALAAPSLAIVADFSKPAPGANPATFLKKASNSAGDAGFDALSFIQPCKGQGFSLVPHEKSFEGAMDAASDGWAAGLAS